jgi:plastocyanin
MLTAEDAEDAEDQTVKTSLAARLVTALAPIALAAACSGGGSSSGASPAPSQTPAATIVITSSGASPQNVIVSPGSQVTFVNNDTRDHLMYSNPHPEHTDCPEFDQVGTLHPGQTKQTGNLNTVRVCGFHDHMYFEDRTLQGSVTIR